MDQMLLSHYCAWLLAMRQRLAAFRWPTRMVSAAEVLPALERATTAHELAQAADALQLYVWKAAEQDTSRLTLAGLAVLQQHVLHASSLSLRLEAARWLRFFVQAGLIAQPQDIFVTLVTAAVASVSSEITMTQAQQHALRTYLLILLDCYWPFRYPYSSLTWAVFPAEDVFVPLAMLLTHPQATDEIRELLVTFFAQLPTLEHPMLLACLTSVVQAWQGSPHAGVRQSVTKIRARLEQQR